MHTQRISTPLFLAATVVVAIVLTASAALAAQFSPKAGQYFAYTSQGVTFHTYTTPAAFGASASVVIETPNKLIIQDVQQNRSNNEELLDLVKQLNKPVDRIYISHGHDHHWAGLEMFAGIPVYASETTIADMKKEGAAALINLKKTFGEEEIPYSKVVIPSHVQQPGEEVIDGVKIVFGTPMKELTGPVTWMEFPLQGVVLHHHLAYVDVHVPMPPAGLRARALETMKAKGYQYLIGGHGTPCAAEKFFDETIAYFSKLDEVVKASVTPAEAVETMKRVYPDWGGLFLLEMLMPANFPK